MKRTNDVKHGLLKADVNAPFAYSEAYKALRTNVLHLAENSTCKTIAVTSAVSGEGKSNVSANLSTLTSQADKHVLLVDCNLRKSALAEYFGIPASTKGLADILSGACTVKDAIVVPKGSKIELLPAGVCKDDPSALLQKDAMRTLLVQLRESYDYVFLDTPPVLSVTDAAIIASLADGVLLVVRTGSTQSEEAILAKQKLKSVDAKILGVVMNDFDVKHTYKKDGYFFAYTSAPYKQ